jgi:uncharacterized membrane protein YdjX (TVP38/TMEM64 family)
VARHRRLLLVALVAAALFGVWIAFMPHSPNGVRDLADDAGPYAVLAVLGVWLVATPSLISGVLLAGATGMLLGPLEGSIVTVGGLVIGATAAFLIGRRLGGNALGAFGGRTEKVVTALETRSFRSMLCLRAAPAMPATGISYAAGMSRIGLGTFVAATAIGGAPRGIAYAVLGSNVGDPSALAVAAPVVVLVAMAVIGTAVAGATFWPRRKGSDPFVTNTSIATD